MKVEEPHPDSKNNAEQGPLCKHMKGLYRLFQVRGNLKLSFYLFSGPFLNLFPFAPTWSIQKNFLKKLSVQVRTNEKHMQRGYSESILKRQIHIYAIQWTFLFWWLLFLLLLASDRMMHLVRFILKSWLDHSHDTCLRESEVQRTNRFSPF